MVLTSGSTPAGAGSLSDQISNARAEAQQLAAQIQSEGIHLEVLSQQYDKDQQQVQALGAQIARLQVRVDRARHRVTQARDHLRDQAVDAYMEGSSGADLDALFSSGGSTASAASEYRSVANANLSTAIDRLHQAQQALTQQRNRLQGTRSRAEGAAAQARSARNAAAAAEATQQATLSQVTGHLGVLVHQEQVAEARAAAQAFEAKVAAQRAAAAAAASQAAARPTSSGSSGGGQAQAPAPVATPPAPSAPSPPAPSGPTQNPPVTAGGGGAVAAAESQLGVPYVWGGESAGHGFDCSGLTQWAWAQAGVSIPRTAAEQYDAIEHVPLSALEPGDLLFWNDGTSSIQHVAMYVGGGTVIQAPFTGSVVSYQSIWDNGLVGAGRP